MGWRHGVWRRRGVGRGRPMIPRFIGGRYSEVIYMPLESGPNYPPGTIDIYPDELEALRLIYVEKKSIDEAASLMGVSRGTLWRLLDNGRRKLVEAIISRRPFRLRLE